MTGTQASSRRPLSVAEEIRLIAGAKHGDHANFETLVELYMGRAIGMAMGYVRNRDDAIDLAQDAFYRVYRHLDRFREGEPFAPWFFKILRNCCLGFLEKQRRGRHVSIHPRDDDDSGIPLVDDDGDGGGPSGRSERREADREHWRARNQRAAKPRAI